MVQAGDADGFVGGVSRNYADVLRPNLELIGKADDAHCVIGCYMMNVKGRTIFLADATVNVYPDSRTLAEMRPNREGCSPIWRGATGRYAVLLQLWLHASPALRAHRGGGHHGTNA